MDRALEKLRNRPVSESSFLSLAVFGEFSRPIEGQNTSRTVDIWENIWTTMEKYFLWPTDPFWQKSPTNTLHLHVATYMLHLPLKMDAKPPAFEKKYGQFVQLWGIFCDLSSQRFPHFGSHCPENVCPISPQQIGMVPNWVMVHDDETQHNTETLFFSQEHQTGKRETKSQVLKTPPVHQANWKHLQYYT